MLAQSHLVGVKFPEIIPIGVSAAPKNLSFVRKQNEGIVCDTRTDSQDRLIVFAVKFNHPGHLWPRTHEAHVAFQDVDQLRKFVQLISP